MKIKLFEIWRRVGWLNAKIYDPCYLCVWQSKHLPHIIIHYQVTRSHIPLELNITGSLSNSQEFHPNTLTLVKKKRSVFPLHTFIDMYI